MRVLLGTDGSASAGLAVDLVGAIDWPVGSTIHVVEAIETGNGLYGGPWVALAGVPVDTFEEDLLGEARRALQDVRSRLARPGLEVTTEILRGRPPVVIARAATAIAADLIVVGSRGHGAIESMLLGSVSAEVVDRAAVPVLIARRPGLRRVVLAWDGSDCAGAAASLLRRWPIFEGAEVRVVSVADIDVPWWTGFPEPGSPGAVPLLMERIEESRRAHDRLSGEMAAELRSAGLNATSDARGGDAATEIIAAAREAGAEVIVLGTHGRTGITRVLLGSVARNVLHHAPCSVLVTRAGPGQAANHTNAGATT